MGSEMCIRDRVNSLVGDQTVASGSRQIAQIDEADILLDEDLL